MGQNDHIPPAGAEALESLSGRGGLQRLSDFVAFPMSIKLNGQAL
jgi:hypothetical protein